MYEIKLVTSNRDWWKAFLSNRKTEKTTIEIINCCEDGLREKIERLFKKKVLSCFNEYSETRSTLERWMNRRSKFTKSEKSNQNEPYTYQPVYIHRSMTDDFSEQDFSMSSTTSSL